MGYETAIILGTGWSDAANAFPDHHQIATLPTGVPGHEGKVFTSGSTVIFQGRRHLYENVPIADLTTPIHLAHNLGCRTIILTNACGSLGKWQPGQPVLICDHLNLTGRSPLEGPQFVDMSHAYAGHLIAVAQQVDHSLPEGVYAQVPGPQFETAAEVRMLRTLGADIVGMSTALECIAARQLGMDVLGIGLVTDMAAGCGVSHESVLKVGQDSAGRLGDLLTGIVECLTDRR